MRSMRQPRNCCGRRIIPEWLLIPLPAAIVLVWDYLIHLHYFLMNHYGGNVVHKIASSSFVWWYEDLFYIMICIGFISFPFIGLIADVWIGRYKAILIGAGLCFLSWIVGAIGIIVITCYGESAKLRWLFYSICYLLEVLGISSLKANIIQYNIDQIIGASADQLSTVIYWHSAAVPLVASAFYPFQCWFHGECFDIIIFITSGASITLVLVSHSFFKHKLENITLIKNPIKLIIRVLCYARKHKYPANRSALTYWEEETPSRLDLGKGKYGGPFTEEEVEDVKTFLYVLPLFIGMTGYACSDNFKWYVNENVSLTACLLPTNFGYYISSVILLLLYLYIFRVCFCKHIPRMLARMSVGLFFALATAFSKVIIFNFTQITSGIVQSNKILLIPELLYAISFILLYPVSLEFTIAQSPVHMRGLMVGLWYASWGMGYLVSTILKHPFKCVKEYMYICTSFYYYLTKSILVLLILIVFVILAKRYKYRVRENEVNIHLIVERHFQKYLEQKEEHQKEEHQKEEHQKELLNF